MRNLKKILALALVFAMAFTFTAGAADFTDKADIGASYVDDVNMLVELGVIGGYPDGSFGPQKNITRAEFAKMAYTLKYGSDTNGDLFAAQKSSFTDVEGNANVAWAKGYINYCANQKIVSGVGNNKFNPQGNITVAEATKMILVILGCDPAKEGFTGANWASNVVAKAIELGVFNGWSGDPTALATRELVAKLMKNAVFSPVYAYSAITGTGSQINALGTAYNETLGEKTMGLLSVTGIVVANEKYAITKNAKVEDIADGLAIAPTNDDEESIIYYTFKGTDGELVERTLTIPVALEDKLLGNEVTVFFKADLTSDSWYTNVELIGNVMVTNDTVVYEAPAIAVDLYPNGKTTSTATIAPYISAIVDGEEIKVKAPSTVAKVAKNIDIQENPLGADALDAFGTLAWVSNETVNGADDLALATDAAQGDAFFEDMGKPLASKYRFVSVDGGKTYSYIFKMVADDATNFNFGAVTNYSEAKGSITISNIGRIDLEDANLIDEVDTDDMVVYYRENDVLNIEKVEVVTGEVEALNDDGSAVIGGETYYLWMNADVDGAVSLANYYTSNTAALNEGTTYYVYNGLVLDLEASEETSVAEDYAVILRSSYDEDLDVAYATLAFADNTQSTYEIGKLNVENRREPYAEENDLASDFADNMYFGMVVKYKVMDNGKLDLSGNDFKKIVGAQDDADGNYAGSTTTYSSSRYDKGIDPAGVVAYEGLLNVDGTRLYALNDSAVLFVIYGNPQYNDDGTINRDENYTPVKAVAYKLANKAEQVGGEVVDMWIDGAAIDTYAVSYALNTNKGMSKGIVAAAMTIADGTDSGDASDGDALAYIVDAKRKFNVAEQDYYLQLTLIGEDGLFTANTVVSAPDFSNNERDLSGVVGPVVDDPSNDAAAFVPMAFITYALNAEGDITNMDEPMAVADEVAFDDGVAAEGLYLVNAVSERNGSLFFINTTVEVEDDVDGVKNAPQASVKFAEDGYDVITIDGDEYIGKTIIKLAARTDDLIAGVGNAVIQVNDEGEIIRVFSFTENYTLGV